MIFVTVGTTHFDSLIKQVDALVIEGIITDKVCCQIGSGSYEPTACEWYRSKSSISEDIKEAELIITHGGYTVLECIFLDKKSIAVANTDLTGNHQAKFLDALSKEVSLNWIQDLGKLKMALEKANENKTVNWKPQDLAGDLNDFLSTLN